MSFLIKTGLMLAFILMILPIDREEAGITSGPGTLETLAAVRTVVSDMRGFCERNPATCTTGAQTLDVMRQKAVYSAGVVQAWLSDSQPTAASTPTVMPAGIVATQEVSPTSDDVAALILAADARIAAQAYPPL